MRVDTSADIAALIRARPEGYANARPYGVHVRRAYEARMMRLWRRSSVMPFDRWDPPRDRQGNPTGPRWHTYYASAIRADVRSGRLTADEGERLREYLEILGT